jgi:hypothetical protein
MSRTRTEGSSTVFPAAGATTIFGLDPARGPRFQAWEPDLKRCGTAPLMRIRVYQDCCCTSWSPHRSWIGRELFRSGSRLLAACSVAATREPESFANENNFSRVALLGRALPEGGAVIVSNALTSATRSGSRGVKKGSPSASTVSLCNANFSGLG